MRAMGVMTKIPKHYLLPVILLLTLTAIYIQETRLAAVWFTIGFGFLGYLMRRIVMSPLPFVIAYILGGRLEESARQAFSRVGNLRTNRTQITDPHTSKDGNSRAKSVKDVSELWGQSDIPLELGLKPKKEFLL